MYDLQQVKNPLEKGLMHITNRRGLNPSSRFRRGRVYAEHHVWKDQITSRNPFNLRQSRSVTCRVDVQSEEKIRKMQSKKYP